jgi:ATP-dependent DNA helicase RecG
MNSERIKKLLAEGEGLTVEFKKNATELGKSVFETVCSFSNRYGGYIFFGVDDDGTALGVNPKAAPSMRKNFVDTLNNSERVAPALFINLEEAEIDGKLLLYAYVPASSQIQTFKGRIYDRNEDGDFDITKSTELIARLSVRKSTQFTERRIFPHARTEHLKLGKLMPIVRQRAVNRQTGHPWGGMTDMEIMRSAGLHEENIVTGKEGFNLAAILLFGRDEIIQQAAPGYVTDCLRRVDNVDRYDDRVRVEANLIESFDLLMGFIQKHTLDRFFLINSLNVSVRDHIAKEIVSNILVHREFSGTFPARIIVEKDRILAENWNRSLQPGRIDPDNYDPYPKNPILARFFAQIGFADTLGSGVRNLYKYSKIYSGGEPELIESDIFKTIVPLGSSVTSRVTEMVTGKVTDRVTEKERKVYALILQNKHITQDEMAKKLGVSRKTVAARLKFLKEKGLIHRAGSDTKGHWEISEVTDRVTEMVTDRVTEKERNVFAHIWQNKHITQDEMAKILGVSRKTVAARLKSLKEKGLIHRAGSDTKGHWEIGE